MAADPVALVRTRLLALPAVTALVGQRVYAGARPQNPGVPLVLLHLVGRVEQSHMRGGVDLLEGRVQAHYTAYNREGALALANAADGNGNGSGLVRFRGTISSKRVEVIFPGGTDREEYHAQELLQYEVIRDYVLRFER
jgi:hypothetical protein